MNVPVGRERSIDVAGYRGRYFETGSGPRLVLLASMLVLARTYRDTARLLGRWFRTTVVEMPGTGRADPLPRPWDRDEYAKWVAGFLDALAIDRATMVGHSCSGAVALALAERHPARVERLVLADTVGAGGAHSLLRVLAGRGLDGVLEWRLTGRGWPHVAQNILTHPRNFAYQTWLAAKTDLSRRAALVRAPTLIAWGALDYTFPPRCATALRQQMPKSTLYVSADGSHDWIVDRPMEFADAVHEFAFGPTTKDSCDIVLADYLQ